MDNSVRDSGVDVIGRIPWGTHIGQFYSSKADFSSVLAPYAKSGLVNNEMCLWIYSDNTSFNEIKGILQETIENVEAYLESGQLVITPHTEWYTREGSFNEIRVNKQWNEFIQHALEKGYDGLRAVADTSWLEKSYFRAFSQYEKNINTIISELPFIVICLYDAQKVDIYEIAEIIKNHSYVLTRHGENLELVKNVELLVKNKQLEENIRLLNSIVEVDKMKTEFFSNISHELKTPLNVILSTIQLLKFQMYQVYQDNKESKYLKIMQQNCFRLLRLVNNLIDIIKIDSDYYELKLQNYNIVSLIEEITLSIVEYASTKGISVLFDTNIEEKVIACDPDQIERIILNLLSNAIKFTPDGGDIWVNVLDCGETLKVSVKDNGIGIPPEKQECIFDRFQQLNKSLTKINEGSGIGLSLVKSLVEKHGGKISLCSELDRGSEFIIELPCRTVPEQAASRSALFNMNPKSNIEKIRIEFSDIYT